MEKNSDAKAAAAAAKESSSIDQIDAPKSVDVVENTVPMDIDDIPIPEDIKKEEDVGDIQLPNHVAEKPNNVNAAPPPLPPQKSIAETAENGGNKVKKVTKLPMPPGINQTDLEAIESPPSRSPTPPPSTRAKTPPRKGIMNLPMPPGIEFNNAIYR